MTDIENLEDIPVDPDYTESILMSIRGLACGNKDDTNFDQDLIIHINSALNILSQLGVGPSTGFRITDTSQTWKDFIGERTDLEMIKTDVYLRVKLVFDPPQNSFLVAAIEKQIVEYEWRIEVQHPDPSNEDPTYSVEE